MQSLPQKTYTVYEITKSPIPLHTRHYEITKEHGIVVTFKLDEKTIKARIIKFFNQTAQTYDYAMVGETERGYMLFGYDQDAVEDVELSKVDKTSQEDLEKIWGRLHYNPVVVDSDGKVTFPPQSLSDQELKELNENPQITKEKKAATAKEIIAQVNKIIAQVNNVIADDPSSSLNNPEVQKFIEQWNCVNHIIAILQTINLVEHAKIITESWEQYFNDNITVVNQTNKEVLNWGAVVLEAKESQSQKKEKQAPSQGK
jgi:hypothetical protein